MSDHPSAAIGGEGKGGGITVLLEGGAGGLDAGLFEGDIAEVIARKSELGLKAGKRQAREEAQGDGAVGIGEHDE